MKGILYLIPATLGDTATDRIIPEHVKSVVRMLDFLIVENTRTARRYIRKLVPEKQIDTIRFYELNKHSAKPDLPGLIKPLDEGKDMGLICEAGVPVIADPGEDIVYLAHQKQIRVMPLVGPSSIVLALMGSGLNGENFAFNGYLPIQSTQRIKKIKSLEQKSYREKQTQIFMETPYRNNQILKDLLESCSDKTLLCVASNLTLEKEHIETKSIQAWKKEPLPPLHKQPAIFLISSC